MLIDMDDRFEVLGDAALHQTGAQRAGRQHARAAPTVPVSVWSAVGQLERGERGVRRGGGLPLQVGCEVAVGVDGGLDGLVPESPLDHGERDTRGDQPGDVRVAQVVDPQPRNSRRALERREPDALPEVGVVDDTAVAGRENELVTAPPAGEGR